MRALTSSSPPPPPLIALCHQADSTALSKMPRSIKGHSLKQLDVLSESYPSTLFLTEFYAVPDVGYGSLQANFNVDMRLYHVYGDYVCFHF